jgi:hypothetical protein
MTRACCFRVLVPALALVALALPSSASASTRTWVSGVGDDANPCSRTAPCKTFAGAISKTDPGGEINCLDPGGFGGVTIAKSLTIKCHYTEGGIVVAGTNAIVINAAASDKVTLRGLDINGLGTGQRTSLNGIKVISAMTVHIFDSEISRFRSAITVVPTAGDFHLVAARNHLHDNGIGVFNAPGSNTIIRTSVVLRHNDIEDNTCGSVTTALGANDASVPRATVDCGSATGTSPIDKPALTSLFHNGIHDNGTGVYVRSPNATAELAWNEVTGNTVFGLHRVNGAVLRTFTPASNVISNNAASDAFSNTVGMSRWHP